MFYIKQGLIPNNVSDLFNCKKMQYTLKNNDFDLPRFETVRFGKHSVR